MKSCRISLVLLCFFFAVIVPGLSADESTSLSNAAIVLPFKVDPKVAAAENPYLGFAIGNLLENVLVELPNVPAELRAIIQDPTGVKPGGVLPGKIMLDDNFTERNFKDALLRRQYPVVHIASHFTFNADGNSDDSFLLLGDGKLTMAQIHCGLESS